VSGQGPQRRQVFDPLIDGVMARKAGRSDAEIMLSMKEAGVGEPPSEVVSQVAGLIADPRVREWRKLSPKERNEAFFAAQAEAKQAAVKQARRAAVDEGDAEIERMVEDVRLTGLSLGQLDELEERVQRARGMVWQAEAEAEAEFAADPLWNDQDDDDELESDDDYQDEVA
jgi:hypothetical protein